MYAFNNVPSIQNVQVQHLLPHEITILVGV